MCAFIPQGRNIIKQINKDLCFKNHMQPQYISKLKPTTQWVLTVTKGSVITQTMISNSYTPFAMVHFLGNKQKRIRQNILVYFMQYNVILHTVKFYLAAFKKVISMLMIYEQWCYKMIIIFWV
jgi:hypothetical protein